MVALWRDLRAGEVHCVFVSGISCLHILIKMSGFIIMLTDTLYEQNRMLSFFGTVIILNVVSVVRQDHKGRIIIDTAVFQFCRYVAMIVMLASMLCP